MNVSRTVARPWRWHGGVWFAAGFTLLIYAFTSTASLALGTLTWRPQDTSAANWDATADQYALTSWLVVGACVGAAVAFVLAGAREHLARSWGWVFVGVALAATVGVVCVPVCLNAAHLMRGWGSAL